MSTPASAFGTVLDDAAASALPWSGIEHVFSFAALAEYATQSETVSMWDPDGHVRVRPFLY